MFHFHCGTKQLSVRYAAPADVQRLAQLYRAVQITAQQCHEALNAKNGFFAQCGGMFEISRTAELERILTDKAETVLVGEYNGTVCGLLWFGMAQADTFADLQPYPDQMEAAAKIAQARANGACGYAKEIISVGADTPHEMPYALFYAMMNEYVKRGVGLTIGEVYAIDRYRTAGQTFESGLFNLASYRFLLGCGGVELGCTKQKQVDLENYSVWKTPHVLFWDTENAVTAIRRELINREWRID